MTVDQDELSSLNDAQNTVYMMQRKPTNSKISEEEKIPMLQLPGDDKDSSYARIRLWLFSKFWSSKEKQIQKILKNKNKHIFQEISDYLIHPNENGVFKSVLLMMGSSLANHSLIIDDAATFMDSLKTFTTVKLNSKYSNTVKAAVSLLIRQVIDRRDLDEGVPESFVDDEDDIEYTEDFLPYDIDSITDWCSKNDSQQVVIIFEDAELFDSNVLTRMLSILKSSSINHRFKFIFGLSTSIALFEENLPSFVIESIEGHVVNLNDSSETLTQITDTVLFNLQIQDSADFLLLLGPRLLRELSNYENNELLFLDILKYSYSVYYFSNPLSVLNLVSIEEGEEEFQIDDRFVDLLRRTRSFKNRIEQLKLLNRTEEITALFEDNNKLAIEFKSHFRNLYHFGLKFYRLLDLFIVLQKHFNDGLILQNKYQLYSKIIQESTDFYGSQFYQELISLVAKNVHLDNFDNFLKEINDETFITQDEINEDMGTKLVEDITTQTLKLLSRNLSTLIDKKIRHFLKEFNQVEYKEVFTVDMEADGGENIIRSSFNPFIRYSVESALNNPNSYLFKSKGNSPVDELSKLIEPTLCELFTLYRELNIFINIHDFFIAFKESIERQKLVSNMLQIISDSNDPDLQSLYKELSLLNKEELSSDEETVWEKIVLSWFLQLMGDLEFIGFIKEARKKSETVEKLIWKGI